ncbi:GNAT family N-acetyltransferase [Fodinicola feengrottensis]|uniref:GNAT family N-acetyltransferase n=1 Tax=Fodinicola feengrottensis TaxID=435914 RepID=UPI0031D52D01
MVELTDPASYRALAALFQRIWQDPQLPVDPPMLRALSYAGNYVVGAYAGEEMIGAAVAFLGGHGLGLDRHLHSHITGVITRHRAGGVGYLLKQHQRAWALERGLPRVCWTFDPLVRRNAYFNFHKLGAEPTTYLPDFYGPMDDGINAGQPSDRMYIDWDLASPPAVAAAAGAVTAPDLAGAEILLGHDGEAPGRARPVGTGRVLVAIPVDVERLRGNDPALAIRWRYAVREALMSCFAEGRRVVGVSREGWYVMSGLEEKS